MQVVISLSEVATEAEARDRAQRLELLNEHQGKDLTLSEMQDIKKKEQEAIDAAKKAEDDRKLPETPPKDLGQSNTDGITASQLASRHDNLPQSKI